MSTKLFCRTVPNNACSYIKKGFPQKNPINVKFTGLFIRIYTLVNLRINDFSEKLGKGNLQTIKQSPGLS